LASLDELKPVVGDALLDKPADAAVRSVDVKLDVHHHHQQQGGSVSVKAAAVDGSSINTSNASTLMGNMQYVPMAGGRAAAAAQTPGQHSSLAPAPADAVWYSVPMQVCSYHLVTIVFCTLFLEWISQWPGYPISAGNNIIFH
jgi:hypothetical protein